MAIQVRENNGQSPGQLAWVVLHQTKRQRNVIIRSFDDRDSANGEALRFAEQLAWERGNRD